MDKYVLLTPVDGYLKEYLFGVVIMSKSIENAMVFEDHIYALKWKEILWREKGVELSVNTYLIL